MSSRKKYYEVTFTTSENMSVIMKSINQLLEGNKVHGLEVNEVLKEGDYTNEQIKSDC